MTGPHLVRVVKIGGRAQEHRDLPAGIAAAWSAAPGSFCLVHGGGQAISALQQRIGHEPSFLGGRRITGAGDIELLRMALSGAANKQLVARLVAAGVPAVGLSGEDGALIAARTRDAVTLGRVGTPSRVNVALLTHLLAGGYLPVIAPLSRNAEAPETDDALNVNGDDAAAAIAVALGAHELVLLSDVTGVFMHGVPVPALDVDDARRAVGDGTAAGGMAVKLEAAVSALEHGVSRVRVGDVRALMDERRGTILLSSRSLV
ncbi:MAG TPA: acetylglutamate kinase [Gemmatimonadaceae bacterium]|nr:acetylglutamate kinase [Gemmatimonadaceae bacterium]